MCPISHYHSPSPAFFFFFFLSSQLLQVWKCHITPSFKNLGGLCLIWRKVKAVLMCIHPPISPYMGSDLRLTLSDLGLLHSHLSSSPEALSLGSLHLECFLSTCKSSLTVGDLPLMISAVGSLLAECGPQVFRGDLVYNTPQCDGSILFVGVLFCSSVGNVWKYGLLLVLPPPSPVPGKGEKPIKLTDALSMELATLTFICFPSGKAPVYLRFPQKFHPKCTK